MGVSMFGDNDRDDAPTYHSLPGYDTVVALDRAYHHDDGRCAACGKDADRSETVLRHLWPNDFSARSEVILCTDCAGSDGWMADVHQRRHENAGDVRGALIDALWGFSTVEIYRALIAVGTLALLVAGAAVAATTGVLDGRLWLAPLGVTAVTGGATAAWIRVDPRGSFARTRPAWYAHALLVAVGLATSWLAYQAVVDGLTLRWYLFLFAVLVCSAGLSLRLDTQIRSDLARGVVHPPRMAIVAPARGVVFGAATAAVLPLGVPSLALLVVASVPVAVSLGYLLARAPKDDRLRERVEYVREEIDDLLHGGHF